MPKSTHRKSHKKKLNEYKATTKREQESFRKKMMDHYMKMQQNALASQEEHVSTEDVSGPDIDIEELNLTEELNPIIDIKTINEELNTVIDVEASNEELNTVIEENTQKLDN